MGNGKKLEEFWENDRKRLNFLEQTLQKYVHDTAGKDSEGSEEHSGENLHHLREYVNHQKQIVYRNIEVLNMLLVRV